jgi:hypothetical protein
VLRGTVQRSSFLGDSIDYQVRAGDSDLVLRVVAPPAPRCQAGDAVALRIPPAACVPLADADAGS